MRQLTLLFLALTLFLSLPTLAVSQEGDGDANPYTTATFRGLSLRGVGPALTSGRIADLAVNPQDHAEYYVAVASGGVWKTTNSGTTFEPIFDAQGSYSIGVVTLDPDNPHVVWVGTGENNGQRSVAYGDGVYKSTDGGRSWTNTGLEHSEHIGAIVVDPRDSDVVWVAAQGPLWNAGGDRGLYRTVDGGETWERMLHVSEHTGVSEVHLDPRDPDVMYATAWQRRRKVWTFISGGPESALYKSTDAGETWRKITNGLPAVDLGRIGMCVSPVDPDYVYAIVEAQDGEEGFFRSTDRGESWQKRSSYATSGNYYQEIMCDRFDRDRVVSMNTWGQVTNDGGATWERFGERHKHVDNHAQWQDPDDPDHYLNGNDGGVYETWDAGATWHFKTNLPVTQFYKVSVDQDLPFYNIYGGTQDNFSMGGPSRTINQHGIVNSDWFITHGGDGFETAIDPEDPNIVYAQSQYGVLVRYDRASGQELSIQPQGDEGEALRWNWDAPLLISPHDNHRLYFAANKVFRSDDRGETWQTISGDLSRQLDRNEIPVMRRVWSVDAVAKNASTSIYGNVVALDESPLMEGLLYAGTDDGLVHVTSDGGESWRRMESFPGVPDRTYVNMLVASVHDAGTVYAAFNNHKNGDFRPYLLKSTDRGQSWSSIAGDLPDRGSVYSIAEDHEDPDLLFAGTEFGVYFTRDGGEHWVELSAGLPTIAVRDLAIQRRENDLVLGTFGRGFYVLDDYSALRHATPEVMSREAHVFPVRDALIYVPALPLGLPDKSFQGESYYTAPNPPFGAVFTYHLKDEIKTLQEQRREAEREAREAGEPVEYPSFERMRAEDDEEDPYLLFTVTDGQGNVVRRIEAGTGAGVLRVAWDLRHPPLDPVDLGPEGPPNPFAGDAQGPLVTPGTYHVAVSKVIDGEPTRIVEPVSFQVVSLNNVTLAAEDKEALLAFQQEAGELQRRVLTASERLSEAQNRLRHMDEALMRTNNAPETALASARELEARADDLRRTLSGDYSLSRRQFETPESILGRIRFVIGSSYAATQAPTGEQKKQLGIAREAFAGARRDLDALLADVRELEDRLEALGAPYTPGRWPGGG